MEPHRPNALSATTLDVELGGLGALPEPGVRDGQEQVVVGGHIGRDDPVARPQFHTTDAGRGASHRSDVRLREADALAHLADDEDLVPVVGRQHPDELVTLAQPEGDQPRLTRRVVLVEPGLLDDTVPGHEEQVSLGLVVTGVDHRLDPFTGLELQEVHHCGAPGRALHHRDLVGLESVDPPEVREHQQVRVRRGVDDVGDVVLVLELRAGDATTSSTLGAEGVGRDGLDVAVGGHHDDELLVVDQVLDVEIARIEPDRGASRSGELVADLTDLGLDHLAEHDVVAEDGLELRDRLAQLGHLFLEAGPAEAGESGQGHVEDVFGLLLTELERLGDKCEPRRGLVVAGTDGGDDRVDHVDRLEQSLHDVSPGPSLGEPELRSTGDDLDLVCHVVDQQLPQRERARHPVDEGDGVDGEAPLHRGVLVEVVEDDERRRVLLQVEHEPGDTLGRLVADRPDPLDLTGVDQFGRLLLDLLDRRLVRDLRDDDLLAAWPLDDLGLGAELDGPATCAIGVEDPGAAHDLATRREVRTLHELHEVLDRRLRVVDQVHRRVDDLAEVVGRDVGRHADCDPLAAVDQQVREAGRQHDRLLRRAVEVGLEVDRVLVDVGQQVGRQRREPTLGVAVGRRQVVRVGRAEVAVLVDQYVAYREVLPHPDQREVHRLITVWVVLAEHVADDGGALLVGAVRPQSTLVHRPQDPPVDGFESVAHVGQGPAHDDGHGVVQEGLLHLGLDLDGLDRPVGHRLVRLGPIGCLGCRVVVVRHGYFRSGVSGTAQREPAVERWDLRCRGTGRPWRSSG